MKPVYRYDIEQNSDEWYQIKVGTIGASSATDLLMDKKTKGYQALKDRLVEEKITGEQTESKTFTGNKYTERGHEFEPIAREDYEFRKLENVKLIGVVILDDWCLCSPDGLLNEKGLHQIKCPIFNTQKKYLNIIKSNPTLTHNELLRKIDSGYYKQCQYEIFVSDRDYNVFTSYHPHLPPIDLIITKDEEVISQIQNRLIEIKQEVESEIKTLS